MFVDDVPDIDNAEPFALANSSGRMSVVIRVPASRSKAAARRS
jgi:hypothetical protein